MLTGLIIFCNGLWLLLLIFWVGAALSAKKIVRMEPAYIWLAQMAAFVVAMYLLVFPRLPLPILNRTVFTVTTPVALVATILVTVGIAFVVWARLVLGTNWSSSSALKLDHELIRRGPYRMVRHPIYTGLSIAIFGSALQHAEVRSIVALLICTVGFWSRMRAEEDLLIQQFPREYPAYMSEVPAIIPFGPN